MLAFGGVWEVGEGPHGVHLQNLDRIGDLLHAGKVDWALDFFKSKKTEGYIPETLCFNMVICRLLRDNRLKEVYNLLVEMMEAQIAPDKVDHERGLLLL